MRPRRHQCKSLFGRAHRVPCLVLLLALTACGREPVLRFSDFVRHQRDNVTTRSVPAHSELASRLASDGWRVEQSDGGETRLRMTRDRARIWFFSADGKAIGAELSGRIDDLSGERPRSLFYRLNDEKKRTATRRESDGVLELGFRADWSRVGWNALDLFVERRDQETERRTLELRGFRIFDSRASQVHDESPRTLALDGDDLAMPGESHLNVAFDVPTSARLKAAVSSDLDDSSTEPLLGAVRLTDSEGKEHELASFRLDAGDTDQLDVDLTPWAGQTVELRLAVEGPRASTVRWRQAGVFGAGERQAAEVPVRPAPTARSGRLGRPDVFLIVLDAARADAFGTYGAKHPTPAVDALAAEGTRFERGRSPSSWTGQSIPALISGFHPDTLHTERWGDPLPEEIAHVAELMADAGYMTALWSQHPIYNRTESLLRGFERVHYNGRRKRSVLPTRTFLHARGRPTFALIHLLPPHSPYAPPVPFQGMYSSSYEGDLPPKLGALGRVGKKRLLELSSEDRAYIYDRYLENVAFADWLVSRVLDSLRKMERYEDALVIVTSDHGEAFLEHDQFLHSRELYREFLRVPMVIKWPSGVTGFAPTVEDPTTLIDLVPTLVDGLDLSGGARGFQGRSLLPAVFDGQALDRALYATTRGIGDVTRMAKPRWMFEEGGWRVIHDPVAATTELYDTRADPGELDDLAARHPARTRQLLQKLLLQRWFNLGLLRLGPRAEIELAPELVEELKALGYL